MRTTVFLVFIVLAFPSTASLQAGVGVISINPMEEKLATQLGGYGDREGKPAIGTHDTIKAKALILQSDTAKTALVTMDVCSVPLCVVEESLAKAKVPGLSVDNALFIASHTHGGLEGYSMDRRNIANNPHVGLFDEKILNFVTDRVAKALQQAQTSVQPVKAGSGKVALPGMNRNRRGAPATDEEMTVLRLDRAQGEPFAVFVNYTAHGTLIDSEDMLVSGCWPGAMQRTVEALMPGVVCLYGNGSEGDVSPAGAQGGSSYERLEDYGRRAGIKAFQLAQNVVTRDAAVFAAASKWVALPKQQGAPDFVKLMSAEYHVTQEQLEQILPVMYPAKAPIYGVRVDDFQLMTFPGEPISALGLAVKKSLVERVAYPCVAALTGEEIGYILTKEEYAKSGYEATASFYGETLGETLLAAVTALGQELAQAK